MLYKTFKNDIWDLKVKYDNKKLEVTRTINFESVTQKVALKECLRNSFKQLGIADLVLKDMVKLAMEEIL